MKIINVDTEKCLGCKQCEIACAAYHNDPFQSEENRKTDKSKSLSSNHSEFNSDFSNMLMLVKKKQLIGFSRINITKTNGSIKYYVCRHCQTCTCIDACEFNALTKEKDKPLFRDISKCTGCLLCIEACQFKGMFYDSVHEIPVMCDLCQGIRKQDEYPVCVSTCPVQAIYFENPHDFMAQRKKIKKPLSLIGRNDFGHEKYLIYLANSILKDEKS